LNAFFVLLWLGWIWRRLNTYYIAEKRFWRLAQVMGWGLLGQFLLGGLTLLSLATGAWTGATIKPVLLATAHVMVGALLLGSSLAFLLLSWKGIPLTSGRMKDYLTLTKPGISVMSAVTALAGYLLGSEGVLRLGTLVHATVGTLFVSGGACALNMLYEKDVDARMHRTENRPLPSRRLTSGEALFLGVFLSIGGVLYLTAAVNLLTALIAGLTLCIYLYVYTPMKKTSALNTFFGAVAGALPPVIGWVAASGRWAPGAWVLFAILFFWQYPHFFSLAWLYKEDYARGGLAMLPVVEADGENTARHIVMTTFGLISVSLLPSLLGWAGKIYFAAAFFSGLILLVLGLVFFKGHTVPQARRLFLASVLYLPLLLLVLVLDWTRGGTL
jgi:protoheme IX farnesyltransferase